MINAPSGRDRRINLVVVGIMKVTDFDCVNSFRELLFFTEGGKHE